MNRLLEVANGLTDNSRLVAAAGATTAVFCLFRLYKYFQGGVCTSQARLDGKTVLITGGNNGIGLTTAIDLARRGARVIIASRDLKKSEETAASIRHLTGNGNVLAKSLDLGSLMSVRAFANDLHATEPYLHILINNAGVMYTPRWKTQDGFEFQFGVNHLGHFLLTNLLLDLLKKSTPSRIINVTGKVYEDFDIDFDDLMSEKNYSPWPVYGKSKLANVLFTRELAKRLQGSGIAAFSLHPGVIPTGLGQHFPLPVRVLMSTAGRFFLKSVEQGAQTTIYCAVTPDLDRFSGLHFSDCALREISEAGKNDVSAERLWAVSEKLVGLLA